MIITVNGSQLRGDLIISAVLRSSLSPIPVTFEGVIRVDDDLASKLSEGKTIEVGNDMFYIVKAQTINSKSSQGTHEEKAVQITALLDNVHQTSFVQKKAILKEKITLQEIYRATGATLTGIENDTQIKKFYCYSGNCPTSAIAAILQEEAGQVCWKNGKMKFSRVGDFFKQKPVMTIPDSALTNLDTGFLEHHKIPTYYSTDENGGFIFGNTDKTRAKVFVPNKDLRQLQNMSKVIIQRRVAKIAFNLRLGAGDLISVQGGDDLVIITAAHVYTGRKNVGTGAVIPNVQEETQYTKLWLGSL